jgi:hypothetical protein
MSEIVLEGKIVEVRGGERQISRTYTYGYISLRILVGWDYYSVLVDTSKLNKYGFLPKVGHWIHVEEILSKNKNKIYDPSISRVSVLKHIENPKKR